MIRSLRTAAAVTLLATLVPAAAQAQAQYVAASWSPQSVYFLDGALNPISSFAVATNQPNGITASS